jgi:hypothetical protein
MRPQTIARAVAFSALGLIVVLATARPRPLTAQQSGGLPALERRVAALESALIEKSQEIGALRAALVAEKAARVAADTALANRAEALEGKTRYMSTSGTETYFTGTNLHVLNGLGATNGNPNDPRALGPDETNVNGLGNLIIGYNAPLQFADPSLDRTGSHYLVLGDFNYYGSFGGIAAGWANDARGPYASTLGGRSNRATGSFSTVAGGAFNLTDGSTASILGGTGNRASEIDATVCGGGGNHASARFSNVSGGGGIVQSVEFGWSAGSLIGPYIQGSFGSP